MCRLLFNTCLVLTTVVIHQALGQPVEVVPVRSQAVDRTSVLTGEILPYQRVTLHARANGYVDQVLVDRGDVVKQGQLLVSPTAAELKAQTAEAESRVETTVSARAEAEARLAVSQASYGRLKRASEPPGAIAGNELIQAGKMVEAAKAAVRSAESATRAAKAFVQATKQAEEYLKVTAPFSGLITERYVHPGALVGPGNGSAVALLELEQVSRLRVVVPVPEAEVASVRRGARIEFRVPAYPNKTFSGSVARLDRSLDPKTRTMAVEVFGALEKLTTSARQKLTTTQ
ncbi:MAG: efflux RND transporter periplasmic adaptor subunit [Bryobacterales bacterium]|nr:efflux RND transporter periplasmic adaptor subunit [Bryobacterales bacterium]